MAEVFLATRGDERGVFKRIRADQAHNPAFLALLAVEAEALGRAAHPCVVRRLDAGEGYVVLERGLPLPADIDPLVVLDAVLAALEAAHAAGVVHRDVKRDNVLVTPRGVVLADFGAARVDGRFDPAPGLGTPWAMAPERLRGEPATPASDVWSVGALAYALATGRPPVDEVRWDALLAGHARGLPPFPGPRPRPAWVAALVAPDPGDRPTARAARALLADDRSLPIRA